MSVSKPRIKVFISSPSDVRPERLIAERVVERLAREFAVYLYVEALLWEREPLVATAHFQDHIPPPHEADIVVVILWSRLGVPLPADKYLGSISGKPVTGTEWEFEDAMASFRQRKLPDLLFYRKHAEPTVGLADRRALEDRLDQFDKVEAFVRQWFLAADGASFTAAIHSFADQVEFEERLETHLRELLRNRIGADSAEQAPETHWYQAPFRGLLSFEYEHSPMFFGRSRAVTDVRALLAKRSVAGSAFVLVMGASGSGKSSLIKAGLLPDLVIPGMIGNVGLCRYAVMRPGDVSNDPLSGLAQALLAPSALPELTALHHDADTLVRLLHAAPETADLVIRQGLAEAAAKTGLTERAEARLAIVVDQLEELFTQQALAPQDRDVFVRALKALARSGSVWVVATMRSDFFDWLERLPILAELSQEDGRYLLLQPTEAEIAQMIRQPAREAGLRFETDENGLSLDDVIHEAATKDRSALPLLSFLLDQLWRRRTDNGRLTFAAYRELGGLEGALGRRAEELFNGLAPDVQAALPSVLRMLVTVSEGAAQRVTARAAPLSAFPEGSTRRQLVDAFVSPDARLLVAESEGGEARIRIAHEALLTHWARARDSVAEDRSDLRLRARLEGAAETWLAAAQGDRGSLLLHPGRPLSEADDLLRRRRDDLSPAVAQFVQASIDAIRRSRRNRIVGAVAAAAAATVLAAWVSPQVRDWMDYRTERQQEAARTDIRGTLLAFSTEKGSLANDALGSDSVNGPYIEALMHYINDRTLDLNTLFARVTEQVAESSKAVGHPQLPELSTSLNGRIFLRDPPQTRKTFVLSIGAAQYQSLPKLKTATKDADVFAHAFDGLGYDVQSVSDPDAKHLIGAINSFTRLISASIAVSEKSDRSPRQDGHRGLLIVPTTPDQTDPSVATPDGSVIWIPPRREATNTLAIVYLAGNGVTVDGNDYFVPIDVDLNLFSNIYAFRTFASQRLVRLDQIVAALRSVSAAQVIIFDACRDDPFKSRAPVH